MIGKLLLTDKMYAKVCKLFFVLKLMISMGSNRFCAYLAYYIIQLLEKVCKCVKINA